MDKICSWRGSVDFLSYSPGAVGLAPMQSCARNSLEFARMAFFCVSGYGSESMKVSANVLCGGYSVRKFLYVISNMRYWLSNKRYQILLFCLRIKRFTARECEEIVGLWFIVWCDGNYALNRLCCRQKHRLKLARILWATRGAQLQVFTWINSQAKEGG